MPVVSWTSDLSVGVHAIDTDHKLLLSLINQLHDAIGEGHGQETVGSVLNALLDYTAYHFGREEALMAAAGYPDLEQHKKIHAKLKKKLDGIRKAHAADAASIHQEDVLDFLKNWLTDHIQGKDKQYQPHMEAKPVTVADANTAFNEKLGS